MSLILKKQPPLARPHMTAPAPNVQREFVSVATNFGDVAIKISRVNGDAFCTLSRYDDCRKTGRRKKCSLSSACQRSPPPHTSRR